MPGKSTRAARRIFLHPLRVMLRLSDPVARIVAVLHDVIEDSPLTLDQLRDAGFAPEVLAALDALTKRPGESYGEFIRRAGNDPIARIVKLADLQDNMDLSRIVSPTTEDEARPTKYREAYALLASTTAASSQAVGAFAPTVLKISVGGYPGASYCVEWRGDHLQYCAGAWVSSWKPDLGERIVPSPHAWAVFWQEVDDIGVWNSEHSYPNPGIFDGTSWSVLLDYNGRRIGSSGSNNYPTGDDVIGKDAPFVRLLHAVRQLIGGRQFH
jgi:hypothetical protein